MNPATLTIVGVGLIGGSLGMAARQRVFARVIGVGRDAESLETARRLGAIDDSTLDPLDAARQSDLIVLCTPVDRIAPQALALAAACRAGTLLTDAGSTKAAIVAALDGRLPAGVSFVGGHPLAGSEKRGVEHASPDLFAGRLTVLTPTARTDTAAVGRAAALWHALGARVRLMDPDEHDRALALTSHLPHLTAAALAGLLPPELHELTATGFRDATRIAAGDPSLWGAIFRHNRGAVLDCLRRLTDRLDEFRAALEAHDDVALDRLLTQAKEVRDALGS
jgi:prephenate dehydrogenase